MAERMELRTKVEQRQKDLELALVIAKGQSHPEERLNGIQAELRVAADAVQGGWDKVSEAGAQALSNWLESTKVMVIPPKDHGASTAGHGAKVEDHSSKVASHKAKA